MAHINSTVVIAATSIAALAVAVVLLWKNKKRRIEDMTIPSKWTKVGEVGELIFYPLKGAKRKCVTEAQVTKLGLRELEKSDKLTLQDRVFVVIDDKNGLVNIKKYAKMLLIDTTAVDQTKIKFSFPDAEDLIVEVPDSNQPLTDFLLYGDSVQTVDCGEKAATWFSECLIGKSSGLRLGCYIQPVVQTRDIEGDHSQSIKRAYPKFCKEYTGAYADTASYLLISEESIKDLNSRLETPVTGHHFRPNIMVKGCPAYSEDSWDWMKIGDSVVLRSFKGCTRCVVTTINPDTAERNPTYEPLKTLRKFRQVKEPRQRKHEGDTPVMGLYAGCHQIGKIRVGDPIYIGVE